MRERIKEILAESIAIREAFLADAEQMATLERIVSEAIAVYRRGGKILLCGNGGSAADAQHIAAELSGRFYLDRPPLNAEALHVNASFLTAVANDYGFEEVYARMAEAAGQEGDMLILLSTSGNSPNILKAAEAGKKQGMVCVGFTGQGGGRLKALCDFCLEAPSKDTPRIQEMHVTFGHILCEIVEKKIYNNGAG